MPDVRPGVLVAAIVESLSLLTARQVHATLVEAAPPLLNIPASTGQRQAISWPTAVHA
jgi:hypothetical protein